MKRKDFYLKVVLSVIAINLTILSLTTLNVIPTAQADGQDQPVDVNIVEVGGGYVTYGGPISVQIDD